MLAIERRRIFMHEMIASPQSDKFVIVRPGEKAGMQIPRAMFQELSSAVEADRDIPNWLLEAARRAWSLELGGRSSRESVLIRPETAFNYGRASWEINKGCNFNCEHCYLAERKFEGLPWKEKQELISMLRDAGVLWLQITGGEPTIDKDFMGAYEQAYRSGMMIEILTNGSRLHRPEMIELFKSMPPHRVKVSLYGATPDSFDSLTRKRGAFNLLMKGLSAAKAAELSLSMSLIITKHNAHEIDAMRALGREYATAVDEFSNISPTYDGSPEPLGTQAPGFLDKSAVFSGCPAGHTFFHVDPHGFVTMCKIGRENPISLMDEGLEGLWRLPAIADAQMLRTGGCSGCQLSGSCRVCRPLAKAYQQAKAPLESYCQHEGDAP
ncbi:radical SAM protein [Streptomyces sp. NPDC090080]|uniref:radical SAM protein n=1 Tax=Streptomyces sp. NPDC090080 TaxID=3365939 RepID=UPI00382CE4D4